MESNFFFKCSLNHVENAVWRKIYNLGFEDKFLFETNILESLKVHFVYGQFLPSPSRAPHPPNHYKNTFSEITPSVFSTRRVRGFIQFMVNVRQFSMLLPSGEEQSGKGFP